MMEMLKFGKFAALALAMAVAVGCSSKGGDASGEGAGAGEQSEVAPGLASSEARGSKERKP